MILIKSIALAVPMYVMQTFQLPKAMLRRMDRLNKNFLWNFQGNTRHRLHLKSWKDICTPKIHGGLGMRLFTDLNTTLLTKLAWEVNRDAGKTWVKLIKAKYLRGRKLLDTT